MSVKDHRNIAIFFLLAQVVLMHVRNCEFECILLIKKACNYGNYRLFITFKLFSYFLHHLIILMKVFTIVQMNNPGAAISGDCLDYKNRRDYFNRIILCFRTPFLLRNT